VQYAQLQEKKEFCSWQVVGHQRQQSMVRGGVCTLAVKPVIRFPVEAFEAFNISILGCIPVAPMACSEWPDLPRRLHPVRSGKQGRKRPGPILTRYDRQKGGVPQRCRVYLHSAYQDSQLHIIRVRRNFEIDRHRK
jgi:hypothetical protein